MKVCMCMSKRECEESAGEMRAGALRVQDISVMMAR